MAQVAAPVDLVTVAAALLRADDIPLADEVGDDLLSGTLPDADESRDLTHANGGVASEAEQHISVVAQEKPVAA
jgi:hypothetical protein